MACNKQAMDKDELTRKIFSNETNEIQNFLEDSSFTKEEKGKTLQSRSEGHIGGHEVFATPFQWCCIEYSPEDELMEKVMLKMIEIGGKDMLKIEDSLFSSNGLQYALGNRIPFKFLKDTISKDLVTAVNKEGDNAIHIASRFNIDIEVVKLLIEKGGKDQLEAENESGCLPIHYAFQYSSLEVVKLLLDKEHGHPEPLMKTKDKLSLLSCAFDGGNVDRNDIIHFLCDELKQENVFDILSQDGLMRSMFSWTFQQPPQIKAEVLRRSFIRKFLNASFIHPVYLTIVFIDVYAQLTLVLSFSIGIDKSVIEGDEAMNRICYGFIISALASRGFREFLQIATSPMNVYVTGEPYLSAYDIFFQYFPSYNVKNLHILQFQTRGIGLIWP